MPCSAQQTSRCSHVGQSLASAQKATTKQWATLTRPGTAELAPVLWPARQHAGVRHRQDGEPTVRCVLEVLPRVHCTWLCVRTYVRGEGGGALLTCSPVLADAQGPRCGGDNGAYCVHCAAAPHTRAGRRLGLATIPLPVHARNTWCHRQVHGHACPCGRPSTKSWCPPVRVGLF